MKNATIAVLFEGYAPFSIVHIFESFPIPFLWISWILSSALTDIYCWWKLEAYLELKMKLYCKTAGWSHKENGESISTASSCTNNNNLFDDDKNLQVYISPSLLLIFTF